MKTLLSLVSITLLLNVIPVALAQESANNTVVTTSPTPAKTTLRADIQAAKAAFQEKVSAIKDARKQALIEKIDTTLANNNTERTTRMQQSLATLAAILDRVGTRAASLSTPHDNITNAITTARNDITSAQTAVTTQAGKTYTMQITTDDTLRQAAQATIQQFRTDITATHQAVVSAQQAVLQAIHLLMQSESATLTPTALPTQ